MKFHKEWQHPDCAVMKWYKLQSQSSTRFTSIQHRRTLEAPFFHEFLLIELTDGSICRVERMGDGSRTDAVRWIGCTSYDIIQWFTSKDYNASPLSGQPSELITQVDFGRTFDLLDVLAICHSVRLHRRALSYTLQRFNCYFLCWTILTILSRRVAEWEQLMTQEIRGEIVGNVLGDMDRIDLEDATHYFAFGICSLIDPGGPSPAASILEPLRSMLDENIRATLQQEVARNPWQKNLGFAVESRLLPHLVNATTAVLEGNTPSQKTLRSLLGEVNEDLFPRTQLDLPSLQRAVSTGLPNLFSEVFQQLVEQRLLQYRMEQLEGRYVLSKELLASAWGGLSLLIVYGQIFFYPPATGTGMTLCGLEVREVCKMFHVSPTRVALALQPTMLVSQSRVNALNFFTRGSFFEHRYPANSHVNMYFANRWAKHLFPILLTFVNVESPNIAGALVLLNSYLPSKIWEKCVYYCVSRKIKDAVDRITELRRRTLSIRTGNQTNATWSIPEFQTYLLGRIQSHAERVESYKLAAAPLVQADVEKAISDIWASLPDGFGSTNVEPQTQQNSLPDSV